MQALKATAAALGLTSLLWSSAAEAESADPIERAQALAQAFEIPQALAVLRSVVEDESAPAGRRVAALELTGVLQFDAAGQEAASATFTTLLLLDPGHQLSDPAFPPRVRECFERASAALPAEADQPVEVEATGRYDSQQALAFEASLGGETRGVQQVVLFHRAAGQQSYAETLVDRTGDGYAATVTAPEGGVAVEFYVEARAPSGHVLGRAGMPDGPLQVEALVETPDDGRPRGHWYTSWWFWTIVGVAVAGGTTAAVLLTVPGPEERGSLGAVHLP
jgi:hypothetical protein